MLQVVESILALLGVKDWVNTIIHTMFVPCEISLKTTLTNDRTDQIVWPDMSKHRGHKLINIIKYE